MKQFYRIIQRYKVSKVGAVPLTAEILTKVRAKQAKLRRRIISIMNRTS